MVKEQIIKIKPMKKLIALISIMILITVFQNFSNVSGVYGAESDEGVQVWYSSDLADLAEKLVHIYNKKNPETMIKLEQVPENAYGKMIRNPGVIGLISEKEFSGYSSEPIWRMVVGRDIFVPVMNPENPYVDEIRSKGLSVEKFKSLYTGKDIKEKVNNTGNNYLSALSCWCMSGDSSICYLADFLNTDPKAIQSEKAEGQENFINSICNDKYAIGFCKLSNITDPETHLIDNRVMLIPIDLNANNTIDHFENIYSSTSELERGVWIGKYPKVLYSNIFTVSGSQPADKEEQEFLKWLSTDGQQYLYSSGHIGLILSERISNVQDIYASEETIAGIDDRPVGIFSILLFAGLAIVGILLIFLVIRFFRYGRQKSEAQPVGISSMFGETSVKIPEGIFFDRSHTWAFMEKEGNVRTGIDDFLQHVTGPITRVIMKKPGEQVTKGETFLTLIQNGKQLKIQSPVSGTILEINDRLRSDSSILNSGPYSEGWVYMIKSMNWMKEIRVFSMGNAYKTWLKDEFSRLKDFLALKIKPQLTDEVQIVMQDGGELKEGLLEYFGPEVWEEFQTDFIDKS